MKQPTEAMSSTAGDSDMNGPARTRDAYLQRLLAAEERRLAPHAYLAYHRVRYEYCLAKCLEFCPAADTAVLDVGRSELSWRLREHYHSVTTLGLPLDDAATGQAAIAGPASAGQDLDGHLVHDLNDARQLRPVATVQRFGLIVFAEVIEHLFTAPELTLYVLAELLEPGGIMIVQTPNAAALPHRLRLLGGRQPYERIRINQANPGHFREYTRNELRAAAETVGLEVVAHEFKDYFAGRRGVSGRLGLAALRAAVTIVPSLARGQSLVLRCPV